MIMIICALLIRENLANRQRKRQRDSIIDCQRNSVDQQIIHLLFVQIICYIIFITPQLFYLIFNIISSTIPDRSGERLTIERFIAFIAELILYLFPVTSFYLYTLTSRTFRGILMKSLHLIDFSRIRCFNTENSQTESMISADHHVKTHRTIIYFSRNRT